MAFTWPVNARVTQTFASNPSSIQPNGHTGVDFAVNVGTPVLATGPGTVVFEGWATTLSANNPWWIAPAYAGICVVIDHGNGILSLYGHLSETYINTGDKVAQGTAFAASGNTGLSSGPHLHFELLGWPLQPYNGFYGRINPNNHVSGHWTGSISPAGDVTPKAGNERLAGNGNVNQRSAPNTTAGITRVIAANTIEVFEGYVIGENFNNIDTWYKDVHGYCWAGAFTNSSRDGLANVTPVVLAPNQRMCGSDNANQRSEPNTSAPVVRVIAANTMEEFTGFVYGENFNGINVWYKDVHGYTWAGGFTDSSTNGLSDLTPAPPVVVSNERIVGASQLNQRKLPNTGSDIVRVIEAGSKEIFTHYAVGQKIEDIDLWYKDSDGYVWSGGFTEQKIDGLERFDIPVVPEPEPEPDPVDPGEPVETENLSGIDISNHQKGIDLLKIEADFFIIKSSEGIGWTDPEFLINLKKARDTGMLVGFYHFARPVESNTAQAEAESFLKIVGPHIQIGDVLVLDWEAENQQKVAWAEEWLDIIAKATNSNPLIYMNLSCANTHNWGNVKAKYKLWLAQYPSMAKQGYGPLIPEHGKVPGWSVAMWQYTSSGRLDNWAGDLDLNVFYGTPNDWDILGVKDIVIEEPEEPVDPDPTDPIDPVDPPINNEKAKLMSLLEKAVDEYLK